MARFETFARDLQMATADLDPAVINRELAKYARASLRDAIAGGEASSVYTKYVNGREGAEEETVEVPGPIVYDFSYWQPILAFALAELEKRSPRKTGDYIASHVVMVGSQVMRPDAEISAMEEVSVVATVPYARKIESGFQRVSTGEAVFQDVRRKVQSQFGRAVDVRFRMVYIPNGYILKGRFRRGRKQFSRTKLQRDTQAGARMTYPAIVMSMKAA
ncbi:MAG TPA: hypothetical protein VGO06_13705 [Bosea sp. (in: a-proteobacteria)]|jgi:hypothetical protein|uniref:hypothetical protein n=1 Tax=Bosea sp. (in: a-proteobacteria) TaxID=1871050 RepID=UPI002E11BB56|nr:hypothetical protein [Bosea sp. (in: a-proteobacteria)]